MPRAHDHGDAGVDTSYFPQKAGARAGYTDPAPGCHKAQGSHTICPLPARRLLTTLCFLQSHSIACSGVFTVSRDSFAISSKCSPHSLQPKKVFMYPRITCSTALGSPSRPVGKESSWNALYIQVHTHSHMHTHMYTHMCTLIPTYGYTHVHLCTHIHLSTCTYAQKSWCPRVSTECKEE